MDKSYVNKQYPIKKVSFSKPEYTTILYYKTAKKEKRKNNTVYSFLTYPIISFNLTKKK
jgi:hypothetical protein